ncbi:MAG TPA: glycosyltransferase family 2 protein [Edaphobacter sp.]|nr:glycosyltransferase family 2 protein [Edaphobacter sp.]
MSENLTSRVTVCIPTYNQSRYVLEAISSAVKQTVPVKVLVSNDGSSDDTALVLANAGLGENVTVVNHPKNVGIGKHVNWVLKQPETDLIVRLDSDDILYPAYVAELTALMDRWPKAGYAHCTIQEIDEEGISRKIRRLARGSGYEDAESSLRAMVRGYRVAANIILFRKEALLSAGFGNPQLNFAEDYDLCVRIADAGWGNVYADQVLAGYRVWRAPNRQSVARKTSEIAGLQSVFCDSLTGAYSKRNWGLSPLKRRRFELALGHSQYLDEAKVEPDDWRTLQRDLTNLAGASWVQILFADKPASRYTRGVLAKLRKAKLQIIGKVKAIRSGA